MKRILNILILLIEGAIIIGAIYGIYLTVLFVDENTYGTIEVIDALTYAIGFLGYITVVIALLWTCSYFRGKLLTK